MLPLALHRRFRLSVSIVLAAAGCAGSTEPDPRHPTALHEITCDFVGLEAVRGPNDIDADYVTLLAVYRFSTSDLPPPKQPLALKFQVTRSRVDALRNHLSARPEVICSPDAEENYTARVDPFDGFMGVPQR